MRSRNLLLSLIKSSIAWQNVLLADARKMPFSTPREKGELVRRQKRALARIAALKAAREEVLEPREDTQSRVLLEDLVRLLSAAEKAPALQRQTALERLARVASEARAYLRGSDS